MQATLMDCEKNKYLLPTARKPLIYLRFLKSYNYTPTKGQVLIGLALFSFPEFSRCTELCIFRYPFLLLVEGLIPYYIAGGSI